MALDIARTPRTRGPSQKITRPPASWIRFSSSGRSGCSHVGEKGGFIYLISYYSKQNSKYFFQILAVKTSKQVQTIRLRLSHCFRMICMSSAPNLCSTLKRKEDIFRRISYSLKLVVWLTRKRTKFLLSRKKYGYS